MNANGASSTFKSFIYFEARSMSRSSIVFPYYKYCNKCCIMKYSKAIIENLREKGSLNGHVFQRVIQGMINSSLFNLISNIWVKRRASIRENLRKQISLSLQYLMAENRGSMDSNIWPQHSLSIYNC